MCEEKKDTQGQPITMDTPDEMNVYTHEIPTINDTEVFSNGEDFESRQNPVHDMGQSEPNNTQQPNIPPKKPVKVRFKKSKDSDIPFLDARKLPSELSGDSRAIDAAVQQNTIESDQDYREITKTIIEKTSDQLEAHTNAKKPLRLILLWFVIGLLSAQFIALVLILFFNNAWHLEVSDFIINVYVVSLFLETLAGLMIMIKFSFDSKQEVQLIKVLNAIIRHFKKFDDK